jgi:hypothetical protein
MKLVNTFVMKCKSVAQRPQMMQSLNKHSTEDRKSRKLQQNYVRAYMICNILETNYNITSTTYTLSPYQTLSP